MSVQLTVSFPALVELQGRKGPASRKEGVGLCMVRGELCFSAGSADSMLASPVHHVVRCHTKMLESGKLTVEITRGKTEPQVFLVSKANPSDLKRLLRAMEEAQRHAKGRGLNALPQADAASLLKEKFPEELKAQMKAMAKAAQRDAPSPNKGHKSQLPAQVGKQLASISESLGLTTHVHHSKCNAQCYVAVAKETSKLVGLEIQIVSCEHHKWTGAVWLDINVSDSLDAHAVHTAVVQKVVDGNSARCACLKLPHSAMRSKLPAGLFVSIRNGAIQAGGFGTRLELRHDDSSAPLGVCDLRYWEKASRVAAPICVLFQMSKEPCNAWSAANNNRPTSALAPTLVKEVEVFVSRLAVSAIGSPVRPKILVAGWEPQVNTAGFVKREFRFHDSPDSSLGFKLLPRPEVKVAAQDTSKAESETTADAVLPAASRQSNCTPAIANAAKRKRSATVDSPVTQGAAVKKPVALSKGARAEMLVDGADSEEVSVEPLLELKTFHWGSRTADDTGEVIELGEISQMGKFGAMTKPVVSSGEDSQIVVEPVRESVTPTVGASSPEGMDEIDCVLAEIGVLSSSDVVEPVRESAPSKIGNSIPDGMDEVDFVLAEIGV